MSGGGFSDAVAVDFGHDERTARDQHDRQPSAVTTRHVTPARAMNTPHGPCEHLLTMSNAAVLGASRRMQAAAEAGATGNGPIDADMMIVTRNNNKNNLLHNMEPNNMVPSNFWAVHRADATVPDGIFACDQLGEPHGTLAHPAGTPNLQFPSLQTRSNTTNHHPEAHSAGMFNSIARNEERDHSAPPQRLPMLLHPTEHQPCEPHASGTLQPATETAGAPNIAKTAQFGPLLAPKPPHGPPHGTTSPSGRPPAAPSSPEHPTSDRSADPALDPPAGAAVAPAPAPPPGLHQGSTKAPTPARAANPSPASASPPKTACHPLSPHAPQRTTRRDAFVDPYDAPAPAPLAAKPPEPHLGETAARRARNAYVGSMREETTILDGEGPALTHNHHTDPPTTPLPFHTFYLYHPPTPTPHYTETARDPTAMPPTGSPAALPLPSRCPPAARDLQPPPQPPPPPPSPLRHEAPPTPQ